MTTYARTLSRVEGYFDGTATKVWEQLTSDAPVSRIRATVRAGRDEMRALILSRLPADLTGRRILDAGCGTGAMCEALADRGAQVVGVDISPALIEIAARRLPETLRPRVAFAAGDMLADRGHFDAVVAMDSLIYYARPDLSAAVARLAAMAPQVVFTLAPRSPALMAMWYAGKAFPRRDRSPVMNPISLGGFARETEDCRVVNTVRSGFYTSACLEVRSTTGAPRPGPRAGASTDAVPGRARNGGQAA
ncbi:MAG: magnesium protoporphyrin IX methyltransferase [Shimia sp.]